MRCHISLPDNCQLLEIEVDVKATGQQCLDKVSLDNFANFLGHYFLC